MGPTSGATVVTDLAPLVASFTYKPGWRFKIAGPLNGYLCAYALTPNSLASNTDRVTQHQFKLPPTPITVAEFARWLLDSMLLVERHEAAEFLAIDGFRPFWPHHQDDGSPYEHVERWETP